MDEVQNKKNLGKRVRYLRKLEKLTQAQLAERMELTVNYISQIETGVASPTFQTLVKLANCFAVILSIRK